jgi:hypothetical protein
MSGSFVLLVWIAVPLFFGIAAIGMLHGKNISLLLSLVVAGISIE